MEDAHAAILDLQVESDQEFEAASVADRLSFFGVYDGHGGDKVALFAGENIHKILAKQAAFKSKDFEQALKDGFLATDRAILSGEYPRDSYPGLQGLIIDSRSKIRRRSIWMHGLSWPYLQDNNLRGAQETYNCFSRPNTDLKLGKRW